MFRDLVQLIHSIRTRNFDDASQRVIEFINDERHFLDLIAQIGMIPEEILHDSREEKLFSKASDAVLARCFRTIGLDAEVLRTRGNSADVFAWSTIHGYTLVADAKAFRLSRTAKNQKDFKVVALSSWKNDSNYAVLCAPYYQYPVGDSQIYGQAVDHNVCLFSWEHMHFLIENGIRETEDISFQRFWNFPEDYGNHILHRDVQKCFLPRYNAMLLENTGADARIFERSMLDQITNITLRGEREKIYLTEEKNTIEAYSREQAISELIKAKKICERIQQIDSFIGGLNR